MTLLYELPLASRRRWLSRGLPSSFTSISPPPLQFICFSVTAIALRWGFLEASIVSLLSVACLDYFFTQPLFAFYMSDSHDWVALITFESVALLVSRLSNQVRRHVRESEMHRSRLQKLYELSQNILLLDRRRAVDQQIAGLIQSTLQAKGVALWKCLQSSSVDEWRLQCDGG